MNSVYLPLQLLSVLVLSALSLQAADRVLVDESSPSIVFRMIAVSADAFSEEYVIRRCRSFLADNQEKKLIVLTLVPDQPNATFSTLGCDHCKPYPFWMIQYKAIAKEKFPIGELIALDGSAVLRYRNTTGTVSETVLTDRDPRPVLLDSFQGRIVHFGLSGRMPKPWLQVYVVGTGTISAKAGADYIAAVARQMGLEDSTVEFRPDPWFINEIWGPWFPLFEQQRGEPPGEAEFNSTKTLRCFVVLTIYKTVTNTCSWKGSETLP